MGYRVQCEGGKEIRDEREREKYRDEKGSDPGNQEGLPGFKITREDFKNQIELTM